MIDGICMSPERQKPVRAHAKRKDVWPGAKLHHVRAVLCLAVLLCAFRGAALPDISRADETEGSQQIPGLVFDHTMDIDYATCFSIDCYKNGYRYISIKDDADYLLVPEGKKAPDDLDKDIAVLQMPIDSIYLAATSAMDFFDTLDQVGRVTMSSVKEDSWYSENAREAMESGQMTYAGKYSAPDYEMIVDKGCDLAIESTMIYHKPEAKEMLEGFHIPVMVEHSSYEENPLGRSEWIKLYGALCGREEEADREFEQMKEKVEAILKQTQESGESVQDAGSGESKGGETEGTEDRPVTAFFSINSNGSVTVYKSAGYVPKMIKMAGGSYAFQNLGDDNALSTVNMQMEEFYAQAKDADYLIYNSTIEGEIHTIRELLDKSSLLGDFKAVKEERVYCTSAYLFQKPTGIADFIVDLSHMYQGDEDTDFTYLHRVES